MHGDPVLKAAVEAVGVHYSRVDGKYTTPDSARSIGQAVVVERGPAQLWRGTDRFEGLAYWSEFWPTL